MEQLEAVFASDDDIIKNAAGQVKNNSDHNLKGAQPRPVKDGLYDPVIFGATRSCSCGHRTTPGLCPSCQVVVYSEDDIESVTAYYQLAYPYITDLKLGNLKLKFDKLGIELPKVKSETFRNGPWSLMNIWSLVFETRCQDKDDLGGKIDRLMDTAGGVDTPLAEYDLEGFDRKPYKLYIYELQEYSPFENCGLMGLKQLITFSKDGVSLDFIKQHINSVLPIPSVALRRESMTLLKNNQIIPSYPAMHYDYKKIIGMDSYIRKTIEDSPLMNTIDKVTLCYMMNVLFERHIKNTAMMATSKEGTFRKNISVRTGQTMRGNAISYKGALMGELYLPRSPCYHALQFQIINKLVKDGGNSEWDAVNLYVTQHKKAIEAFEEIVANSQVLMNRNPTLHRQNFAQYTPKLWPDDTPAIGVNPMVCFTGDTKVLMTNGDEYTFEELTRLYQEGETENLFVYATDTATNERVAAHFKNVGIRQYVHDLIDLEFPGGTHIKCTPEHKFRCADGSWIEARNITTETELDEIDFSAKNPLDKPTPHGTTICYIDGTYHSNRAIKGYLAKYGIDQTANLRLKFNVGVHEKLPKCKVCEESCYVHKLHGVQGYCYEHYIETTKQSYCYFCNKKIPIKLHKKHLKDLHDKTRADNLAKKYGYETAADLPLCAYCGKNHVKVSDGGVFKYCSNECQLYDARAHCDDPFGRKKRPELHHKITKYLMKKKYDKTKPVKLYLYTAIISKFKDSHFKIGITSSPNKRPFFGKSKKNPGLEMTDLTIIAASQNIDMIIELEEAIKMKYADLSLVKEHMTELIPLDKYEEVMAFVEEYYENHK